MKKSSTIRNAFLLLPFLCCALIVETFAQIEIDTENTSCNGESSGKATINVKGISGDFRYSISRDCYFLFECDETGFQSSNVFDNLEEGTYTATVLDKDTGCNFSKDFTIEEPSELDISISGSRFVFFRVCDAPPTVTLVANASGGTGPYTYSPSQVRNINGSGTYSFTVTDDKGCSKTESITVRYIDIFCSRDPNDIVGPVGINDEKWIAQNDILPYTIRFENDPEFATAPAQVVKIKHPLDPNVNINSLRLGNFGFANMHFEIPADRTYYSTRLDVVDSLGVVVNVTAGIDVTKKEAFWLFESFDPATGLPPQDATLGFLPVNDSLTAVGEGFVSYTIKPGRSTVTGDSIFAEAEIIFDINEPILTPKIFNTIDAKPPASEINPVPTELHADSILWLSVNAFDDAGGCGVKNYDIYVSENNAQFELMTAGLAPDSVFAFKGSEGISYCMYSVARDLVNNTEVRRSTGDICFNVPRKANLALDYPSGNETICADEPMSISWRAKSVSDIDILYSLDGETFVKLAESIPASDSIYNWQIPATLSAGNYWIKLHDSQDTVISAQTASPVTVSKVTNPAITSSNGIALCAGDSTLLSGPAGYQSYRWLPNEESAQQLLANTAGEYILEVTDEQGCVGRDTVVISVSPRPEQPEIYYDNTASYCQGDTVIMTAGGNQASYLWSTGETTQSIKVAQSGIYYVQAINSQGCTSLASLPTSIVINEPPAQPTIYSNTGSEVCEGEVVSLSAPDGFDYYSWSNGELTQTIQVSSTGTYKVTVTDNNGCQSPESEPFELIVKSTPEQPVITANGSTTFCEGSNLELAAPAGYAGYLWSTGETTATIQVAASGEYSVRVTSEFGCESPVSDPISVTVLPASEQPVVTPSGSTALCPGEEIELSAPVGYAAYQWSNGATNQSIQVSEAGNYSVIVTNEEGCISLASEAVAVIINPVPTQPVITVSGETTLCQGGEVILIAPEGYAAYRWSTGETTPEIKVSTSGNYSVIVQNNEGCTSPASASVAVNVLALPEKPVVESSSSTTFCEGGNITLAAPEGFAKYLWSTGEETASILVNSTGEYSVHVINEQGCISPMSDVVQVNVLPASGQPFIEINGSTELCEGESVMLTGPHGYSQYNWSTGETSQAITVSTTGNYQLTVTNSEGCVSLPSNPVVINVTEKPTIPVITVTGETTFCRGREVILEAPSGFATYQWSNGANTSTIIVTESGEYTVAVSNELGCQSKVSNAVVVNVLQLPETPEIVVNGTLSFCTGEARQLQAPAGYTAYEWSTGATSNTIEVRESGAYKVKVTNENGCSSEWSAEVIVDVLPTPDTPLITSETGTFTFCNGEGLTLLAPAGYAQYKWSTGETTPVVRVNESGSYSVVVTNSEGCTSAVSEEVVVTEYNALEVDAGENAKVYYHSYYSDDYDLPEYECRTLNANVLASGSGSYSLRWSTGETTPSIQVCPRQDQVYTLTITDSNGCSFTDSVKVCAVDVRCIANNNKEGVALCYSPASRPGYSETICVKANQVNKLKKYLSNPDYKLGACDDQDACTEGDESTSQEFGWSTGNSLNQPISAVPNPFKNVTLVRFKLDFDDKVSVDLYSMEGYLVANVYNGSIEAGVGYKVSYSPANSLPIGLYILKMTTESGKSYVTKVVYTR